MGGVRMAGAVLAGRERGGVVSTRGLEWERWDGGADGRGLGSGLVAMGGQVVGMVKGFWWGKVRGRQAGV